MAGKLTNMKSNRKRRKEFSWSLVHTKHLGMHFTRATVAKCKTDIEERADCETWH